MQGKPDVDVMVSWAAHGPSDCSTRQEKRELFILTWLSFAPHHFRAQCTPQGRLLHCIGTPVFALIIQIHFNGFLSYDNEPIGNYFSQHIMEL